MPTRATVGENIGTTVVDSFLTDIANKKSANKAEIKRILLYLHSILKNHFGVMLEWLKRHAWKACNRQNRFGGSNPPHSASIGRHYDGRYFFYLQAGTVSSPIRFRDQEKTLRNVCCCAVLIPCGRFAFGGSPGKRLSKIAVSLCLCCGFSYLC